jgi:hypothetical protein
LHLDNPDSLALEVLRLYCALPRLDEMDSSEAGRRANLLQIANNLRGSTAHRLVVDAIKRLVESGTLPREALRALKAKGA